MFAFMALMQIRFICRYCASVKSPLSRPSAIWSSASPSEPRAIFNAACQRVALQIYG